MDRLARGLTALAMMGIALIATFNAAAAQQPQPKRGGTFIAATEGEPSTLTAHLNTDTTAIMVATNLFNGLVGLDYDFNPTPDLADSWTVSPDGLTYTFQLNSKAQWHDGKPVTAADAEYTFNEIIAKVHPRAGTWWPNIEYAKATGPHTFVFKLKQPYAPFLTMLGSVLSSGALILPKHIYEGADPKTNKANTKPIGSGPFKFAKWERGNYIELVRNEKYWKPGLPYLDRLVFQISPDPAARLLAFERGELDFLHWYIVPYDQVARLRKDKRFQIVDRGEEAAATNGFLLMNTRNDYLKDVRVRRALAYAIDRDGILRNALFGEGKVAHSPVSSGLGWIYTAAFDYPFDPAKSNQLLDEAGFKRDASGMRFDLRLAWATGRPYEGRAAEIIKDNLKSVGINVKIETIDRLAFID
jgi:peptide/nickel transport system substrate-binding protein